MAKKIVIASIVGLLGVLVLFWAGLTWVNGAGTQTAFRDITAPPENGETALLGLSPGEYRRGFLASEGVTWITPEASATEENKGLALRHQIYHGPLAVTPDGVKACHSYVITTLDLETLSPDTREKIAAVFGGEAPLTMRTMAQFNGTLAGEIEIPEAKASENGIDVRFAGMTLDFHGAPEPGRGEDQSDLRFVNADLEVGELAVIGKKGEKLTISPIEGSLEFENMKQLKGDLDGGRVDFESEEFNLTVNRLTGTIDQANHGKKTPLLLGRSNFTFEGIEAGPGDARFKLDHFRVQIDSSPTEGKGGATVRYETGPLDVPAEMEPGVGPMVAPIRKGLAVELGMTGVDLNRLENLVVRAQQMQAANQGAMLAGNTGDPSPEMLEAAREYMKSAVEAIEPGFAFSLKTELNGQSGPSLLGLTLSLAGERALADMSTLRDVVIALAGDATISLRKADLPPLLMAPMLGSLPPGFLVETPEALELKANLAGGTLRANGQAIPLLDAMGPALDQPIPWEAILSAGTPGIGQ